VRLRAQVEDVHHLGGPAPGVGARHAVVAAVVAQRLLDVEEAVEVDVLLGKADRAARRLGVVRRTEHADLPVADPDQVADRADQRGLARAVGPEQPEERAVGDIEREAVEGQQAVVVALGEARQLECGLGHCETSEGTCPPRMLFMQ
jgi:hypothetical protein